jgi:ATP-binding cassette subfamily F protein 3
MFAQKPNFLVLDEPTTHLDINGRRALEEELKAYPGSMLVVSHDVEFVRNIATTILLITEYGFTKYQCGYDDFRAMEAKARGETIAAADVSAASESKQAPLSQKEKRKLRAEEREKKAPLLRSLRRRVEATEARIGVLEKEQSELVAAMSDSNAAIDYATINRRMSEIQSELENLNTLWEQAASELAFLEAE